MTCARSAAVVRAVPARRPEPVDPDLFRSALAGHPAGVVVVTAQDEHGPLGLTATSFVSISLDPPLVGFAVDSGSTTWQRLQHAGTLVVHMLDEGQHDLASRFATRGIDRFGDPTNWVTLTTGEPLLTDAPTWLRCDLDRHVTLGDHFLVVGRVLELRTDTEARPLVYHRRCYRSVREHLS
jgi:flavin reductase (DIM6/NTAB) family NADH-FMN oxidoreductase RutF